MDKKCLKDSKGLVQMERTRNQTIRKELIAGKSTKMIWISYQNENLKYNDKRERTARGKYCPITLKMC